MNQKNAIKASLLLASTMTIMAGAIVAPSLPRISEVFSHVPDVELLSRLVLTLPALFITMFSSLAGWSTDRFGRRFMLLGSLLLYAVAGTTGAYVNNLYLILAGRAILGVAVAGNLIAITTLIGDYLQDAERGRFIGFQGSFMAFGGVFFIILAGWLADISWELPFWVYSFSLIVFVLCYYFVPEPQRQNRDLPGLAVMPERHNRKLTYFVMLMGFAGMAFFYIIPAQVPFLLSGIEGVTNSMIGYAISLSTLAGAIVAFFYGKIRQRFSFQWIYAISFLLFATGYQVIAHAETYHMILAGLYVAGTGTGMLFPNANLWMIQIAPEARRGLLVGNLSMAVFLGQFVSPLLVHPLISKHGVEAAFFYPGLIMLLIAVLFTLQQLLNKR